MQLRMFDNYYTGPGSYAIKVAVTGELFVTPRLDCVENASEVPELAIALSGVSVADREDRALYFNRQEEVQ